MRKRFTDIFIKRPVFATSISLVLLVAGIISFTHMPVRLFPKVDASVVTVTVNYPGAPSNVMEGFVATPLEAAVAQLDGIDYVTSSSSQGVTTLTVNLKLGYNIDTAMTNVAAAVNSIRDEFPKNIEPPVVQKSNPSAMPILWLAVQSTSMNNEQLADYLMRVVKPKLQLVEGVSNAQIMGAQKYAMRIWLNPYKMAARHVTGYDVAQALENGNVIAPVGQLKSKMQQINLYSNTDLKTAKQFNDLVIRREGGNDVRIKDIGKAELGAQERDFSVILGGRNAVVIAVSTKSNANELTVANGIKKVLPDIRAHLPHGVTLTTVFDESKFIHASIHEVVQTFAAACFLVLLVIFLMLGSFRAVLIPMVTIPLSLTGACIFMLMFHYTVNILVLLALVLAIGLVVDDAIVVLENIRRHLEQGLPAKQAALIGAREISFPVIAMTLTLAAVFAPIGFMGGLTGRLFTEFAFTLAGAVIVSGLIALTLSPMMCSKIYKAGTDLDRGLPGVVDRIFKKIQGGYKRSITFLIKFRYFVVVIALLIYGSCYFLYSGLQQSLAPPEDVSSFYTIVQGPAAANLDYMEAHTKKLEQIYRQMIPEMDNYLIVNGFMGINTAFSLVVLKDWAKRKRSAFDIELAVYPPMWSIPGIQAFPSNPPSLPGTEGNTPVEFVLATSGSYAFLNQQTQKFMKELAKWPGLVNTMTDLQINNPQVNIEINHNKATDLGIPMSEISADLNTFLSGGWINYFNMKGRSYQVIPQLYRQYRDLPTALNVLSVRTAGGNLVPLGSIVTLKRSVVPQARNHFQQLRSATITANLGPGVSLGTALDYMTKLAHKTLSKRVNIDYGHESRQFVKTAGQIGILMIFALIFIFLILAAQFESFRDPFVIMLTVPLALTGALLGLHLFPGCDLNIYTKIGLLTLIGLITKNGILIVEFANQQQLRGVPFKEAIIGGATERLRPILMTTFAIILGALPLMLATGAMSNSRAELGVVIVFGMFIGTLFTLFILPIMYYLLASKKEPQIEQSNSE